MNLNGLILVLPEKADSERDQVAQAWIAHGGSAEKLGRFWEPPAYDPRTVRLYGNDTFCLVLAQKLGLTLLSPADDLLLQLPQHMVKRKLQRVPLSAAADIPYPYFVKPLVPKQFKAAVYSSAAELLAQCQGLDAEAMLLTSDIITLQSEVRAFVHQAQVLDAAVYEGEAHLPDAMAFLASVAAEPALPRSCVVDVGYAQGLGWVVIEANAAWGAGLNGCDADKVLAAIEGATRFN